MSYIGRIPTPGAFLKLDDVTSSFNGAQTVFNMTSAGVAVLPGTPRNLIISVGGVLQEPDVAYTITGSVLTFTAAPVATQPFWAVVLGSALDVGTISAGVAIAASTLTVSGNSAFSGNVTFSGTVTGAGLPAFADPNFISGNLTDW